MSVSRGLGPFAVHDILPTRLQPFSWIARASLTMRVWSFLGRLLDRLPDP